MLKQIKTHKKFLLDFVYSFVAYALPTIVLQFAVQPFIANHTTDDANGLFIALYNVVKLMISVFIMPLANLRLLKKQECEKAEAINAFFNFLFIIAIVCTGVIGSILNGLYRNLSFTFGDVIRLLLVLLLIGIHDYFMIAFRKIVIDNCLIVSGYGLGMFLFSKTGVWELIFICGYLFGTVFVLSQTGLWRTVPSRKNGGNLVRQYGELGASDLLKNASVYCDRLMIYPVLGGYDVSVYNAAAVVSKAISVVSSPLRNVLLSYIVNHNGLSVSKRKMKKFLPLSFLAFGAVFAAFWGLSLIACRVLYPQYFVSAMPFIPIIIFAVMIETCGAILNIAVLRFAATRVQTIISALKLGVYVLSVVLFAMVAGMGLWGFCLAILLADAAFFAAVGIAFKKNISFTE